VPVLNTPSVSEVAVCSASSLLVMVRVLPTFTVRTPGEYMKFEMSIVTFPATGAALLPTLAVVVLPLLRSSAATATTAATSTGGRMDNGRTPCIRRTGAGRSVAAATLVPLQALSAVAFYGHKPD